MGGESSAHSNGNMSTSNMLLGGSSLYNGSNSDAENYASMQSSGSVSPKCRVVGTRDDGDWATDRVSDAAEAGTSYIGSDTTEEADGVSALLPPPPRPEDIGSIFQNAPAPIVPESFEEQTMLAMAVSLAEAGAMTTGPGSTWQ
uniref:Uncharacterized protein LOC105139983 n=1 Tax=Rhizophora mucronata TaxID=61149 RepID=A0A2P2IX11_RHIMU